ncbi:MAG TPA: oxidoreductase [Mycobacteriales bacterium]|nr:oxidoreductase [Mycobacteriales bacterium]
MPPPPTRVPAPGTADPLAPLLDLPGVSDALGRSREAVDRLLNHRVLRRQSAAVSTESALRGARASAALEGADVPLADLRAGELPDDPVVQGALRVSVGLGALVGVWEQAPLQAIARLHVLAAAGTVPADELGRPRGGPAVAARLSGLAGLVAGRGTAPGTLVAAVVHGELATLAPFGGFGGFDGLVARAAARLTLVTRGVDPKSVSVPEVGHLERAGDYRAALDAYRTGEPDGLARWLTHCATAVELGAQEGLAICEAVLRG